MVSKFLQKESTYLFIGILCTLFTLTIGCFLYYKGKSYFKNFKLKKKGNNPKNPKKDTLKRRTGRNKFLMKRGERADADDEKGGAAETYADKIKAEIDAKYNQQIVWSTIIEEMDADGNGSEIRTKVERS